MKTDANPNLSRRHFLKKSGQALSVSTLVGVTLPHVHAAGSDSIQLAIIGSGSRGGGAVANALQATNSNAKLVAMADLYEDRLQRSHSALYDKFQQRIDVPSERQFIGFDAYKKPIDSLRPNSGDIALLTGYAGFRPQQLEYAVERGVNVFMEKSGGQPCTWGKKSPGMKPSTPTSSGSLTWINLPMTAPHQSKRMKTANIPFRSLASGSKFDP